MNFSEYQQAAQATDQVPLTDENDFRALLLPLLGLAGEVGSLQTQFKRHLRDGEKFVGFKEKIEEELGDILWNVSNLATKVGLDMDKVASNNLEKIQDRWHDQSSPFQGLKLFDSAYEEIEQFPRAFEIDVTGSAAANENDFPTVQLYWNGKSFGARLTDNSVEDDGYRLHDVFHLAFLTKLGWSPVLRGAHFFDCKRRSQKLVDEIDDGGRAAVIEEALSALIFVHAKEASFYAIVRTVEYGLLRLIHDLTSHLEISVLTLKQWEVAILAGCDIWREIRKHGDGKIVCDLNQRKIAFTPKLFVPQQMVTFTP